MRVARRYDEDSVTAFAARGVLGATYVVMSNLYAHGIAQPYVRDAFVRLASAAALTPEELYGDPERVLWPLVGAGLQQCTKQTSRSFSNHDPARRRVHPTH